MKKMIDDYRLMIKACDLYYNQNKTQQQIAKLLNVSSPTVSRLLAGAIQKEIVRIDIQNIQMVKFWELEQKLKKSCGLQDVIIVDSSENPEETKKLLGVTASRYLESIVSPGDKVGISMGSTLYHMAYNPAGKSIENVTFVPLLGGMGRLRTELHANHLAETMAKKYNGTYLPLYAPARVSNRILRKELKNEPNVSEVLALQKELSIAVIGIGYPNENSSIKATGYYKDKEIQSLQDRNVAGDICMQFYDMDGNTALYKHDNHVIGIGLNMLKNIPYSIAVGGDIEKLTAIIGAIKGKYINVLITDFACAEGLLEAYEKMNGNDAELSK